MSLLIQAKISGFKKLKTSANIRFNVDLEELNFEKEIAINQLKKSKGYLFFSNDPIREEVLEVIKNKRIGVSEDELTNSQKVRKVIWEAWNNIETEKEFEDFYNEVNAKMIKAIRKKYGID